MSSRDVVFEVNRLNSYAAGEEDSHCTEDNVPGYEPRSKPYRLETTTKTVGRCGSHPEAVES